MVDGLKDNMGKSSKISLEERVPCAIIQVFGDRLQEYFEDVEDTFSQFPQYTGLPALIRYADQSGDWKAVDEKFHGLISKTAEANKKYRICDDCKYINNAEGNVGAWSVKCPKQLVPELFEEKKEDI